MHSDWLEDARKCNRQYRWFIR